LSAVQIIGTSELPTTFLGQAVASIGFATSLCGGWYEASAVGGLADNKASWLSPIRSVFRSRPALLARQLSQVLSPVHSTNTLSGAPSSPFSRCDLKEGLKYGFQYGFQYSCKCHRNYYRPLFSLVAVSLQSSFIHSTCSAAHRRTEASPWDVVQRNAKKFT